MLYYSIFIIILTLLSFQGFKENGLKGVLLNTLIWCTAYHAMAMLLTILSIMLSHLDHPKMNVWLPDLLQNTLVQFYGLVTLIFGLITLLSRPHLNKKG